MSDLLAQAADLIRREQPLAAQTLLVQAIKQQPKSEEAWYLLSFVVTEQRQQIDCLQRVLRLNPMHRQAQDRLVAIMSGPTEPQPASLFTDWQSAPAEPPVPSPPPADTSTESTLKPERALDVDSLREVATVTLPEPEEDLTELRTHLKVPEVRRSRPWRVLLLLLLVIAVGGGGALLIMRNAPQTGAPPTAEAVIVPPTPTETPTITLTPTEQPPTPFPPTWTPTPTPTPQPTRTPTPPPTPNADAEAALRQVQQQVNALRGWPAPVDSANYLLSPNDVEQTLRSIAESQGLLAGLDDKAQVLSLLGLIRPNFDLTRFRLNQLGDPVGGIYLPSAHQVFIIGDELTALTRHAMAFEAAHAALNQQHPFQLLGATLVCELDAQHCAAIRALVKGDAMLAASQWLRQSASAADRERVASTTLPETLLPDDAAPQYVRSELKFPYEAGLNFVQALYQRGGWAEVNRAFEQPPSSTEHILHPEKYLAREEPVTIDLPDLSPLLGGDWQLIADDVLGEWTTFMILSAGVDVDARLDEGDARAAASGWGGDRYHVYRQKGTGRLVLAVHWQSDLPDDAARLQAALRAYLDRRFQGVRLNQEGDDCWSGDGQVACLFVSEQSTVWLLTPDQEMMPQIRSAFPGF